MSRELRLVSGLQDLHLERCRKGGRERGREGGREGGGEGGREGEMSE